MFPEGVDQDTFVPMIGFPSGVRTLNTMLDFVTRGSVVTVAAKTVSELDE
jgi:hypothetical protein